MPNPESSPSFENEIKGIIHSQENKMVQERSVQRLEQDLQKATLDSRVDTIEADGKKWLVARAGAYVDRETGELSALRFRSGAKKPDLGQTHAFIAFQVGTPRSFMDMPNPPPFTRLFGASAIRLEGEQEVSPRAARNIESTIKMYNDRQRQALERWSKDGRWILGV